MTITATVLEGDNGTDAPTGLLPSAVKDGVTARTLTVFDQAPTGSLNTFELRLDAADIITGWSPQPELGLPVYGFVSISLDTDAASNPQKFSIIRGEIQILFSPEA